MEILFTSKNDNGQMELVLIENSNLLLKLFQKNCTEADFTISRNKAITLARAIDRKSGFAIASVPTHLDGQYFNSRNQLEFDISYPSDGKIGHTRFTANKKDIEQIRTILKNIFNV